MSEDPPPRMPPPGAPRPPDARRPDVNEPQHDESEGCGWILTGCLLPRAVGCLIGLLICLGILGWLWITGQW